MKKMFLIPLEPLTERYTEQWFRRIPGEFAPFFDVEIIEGQPLLSNEIKVGTFLDINSTAHYKWTQLSAIAALFHENKVPDGSHFFFYDLEFWGIEAIRLLADMNGVKVTLSAFLHAGSYTIEDAFAIAAHYQKYTELGWIAAFDYVFVGSQYHKEAFFARRISGNVSQAEAKNLAARIKVTGNPLFLDEYPKFPDVDKEDLVLLTNRLDQEKRPLETLELFKHAKNAHPDWKFVVCTGRPSIRSNNVHLAGILDSLVAQGIVEVKVGITKDEYHNLLARARVMVSHSIEENYGYCLAEAINYKCRPFVRWGLSHTGMLGGLAPLMPKGIDSYWFMSNNPHIQLKGLEYAMSDQGQKEFLRDQPFFIARLAQGMQNIVDILVHHDS